MSGQNMSLLPRFTPSAFSHSNLRFTFRCDFVRVTNPSNKWLIGCLDGRMDGKMDGSVEVWKDGR